MTQATHTPGPWAIFDNSGLTLKRSITVTIGNRKIAFYSGDNFADAHLIHAATDMLAALELIAEQLATLPAKGNPLAVGQLVTARAAIAKARGKTPFLCQGCQRPESVCSAEPCPDVIADREA